MTKDLHQVQRNILRTLLFTEAARFSDLHTPELSSDQITFHVKQLIQTDLVEKLEEGMYRLTIEGKDYAGRLDVDSGSAVAIEKQGKLSVLVVASRVLKGCREYVMQQRLKQPFYGFRGFVTGKIKKGESVSETAARELVEETGLKARIEHKAIYHERIFSEEKQLLEDKYFFIFTALNAKGQLINDFEGERNEWVEESSVMKEIFSTIFRTSLNSQNLRNPSLKRNHILCKSFDLSPYHRVCNLIIPYSWSEGVRNERLSRKQPKTKEYLREMAGRVFG